MTRRTKIIIAVIAACLLLLIRPEILGGLFALVFLGMVPGTNYSLPSWLMFAGYAVSAILVIRWISHQPMYVGSLSRQEKTARALARKKVTRQKKTTASKRTRARRTASA